MCTIQTSPLYTVCLQWGQPMVTLSGHTLHEYKQWPCFGIGIYIICTDTWLCVPNVVQKRYFILQGLIRHLVDSWAYSIGVVEASLVDEDGSLSYSDLVFLLEGFDSASSVSVSSSKMPPVYPIGFLLLHLLLQWRDGPRHQIIAWLLSPLS